MQKPETSLQARNVEPGLKALTLCSENDQKHRNSCIMNTNPPPPLSSSFSSQIGDYIGMESCLDLKNYEDLDTMNREESKGTHIRTYRGKRDQRWSMKKKEFPPPISLLARTENQPSHMPFVLKRYYTNDGRLILTEERTRHHEYFRAHRSNGHLTLQLVHLDDDVFAPPSVDENEKDEQYSSVEEEEADIETEHVGEYSDVDGSDNDVEKEIVRNEIEGTITEYESIITESSVENGSVGISGNGGVGKCLNYNSVRVSASCFLGLPVPAIKPVHS